MVSVCDNGSLRAFSVSRLLLSAAFLASVASANRADAGKVFTDASGETVVLTDASSAPTESLVQQKQSTEVQSQENCTLAPHLEEAVRKQDMHAALGLPPSAKREDVQEAYVKIFPTLRAQRDMSPFALNTFTKAQKAYGALSHSYMRDEALSKLPYWSEVEYLRTDDALRSFTELEGGGSSRLRIIFVVSKPDVKVYEAFDTAVRLYGRVRVAQLCPASMVDSTGATGKFLSTLRARDGGVIIFDPLSQTKNVTYRRSRVVDDLEHLFEVGPDRHSAITRVQELNSVSYQSRCGKEDSGRCKQSLVVATDSEFDENGSKLRKVMAEFSDACKKMEVDSHPELACFWLRLGGSEESLEWRAFLNKQSTNVLPAGTPVVFTMRRSPAGIAISPPGEALPESIHSLQQMGGRLSTEEHARWYTFDGPAIYSVGLIRWFEKTLTVEPQAIGSVPLLPSVRLEAEPNMALSDKAVRYFQSFKDGFKVDKSLLAAVAGIASAALTLSLLLWCFVGRRRAPRQESWVI